MSAAAYATLPPERVSALVSRIDLNDTLSRCARAAARALVFCGLHRFDLEKPVLASKAGLAEKSGGYSPRSMWRGLVELEARGLIHRHAQPPRGKGGEWAVAPIGFTRAFFDLLDARKNQPCANLADKPEYKNSPKQSFRDQPADAGDSHKCEVRQGKTIPEDLLPLVDEMQVKPTGVLSLMKEAKGKGHRLSDVLRCALERLRKLRLSGGRAYGYLHKMIGQERDYAWIAKTRGDDAAKAAEVNAARQSVANDLPKLDGKRFKSISTGAILTVHGPYAHSSAGGVLPLNASELPRFLAAIEARQLVECG